MFVEQMLPRARERLAVSEGEAPVREAAALMSKPLTDLVVVCDHGDVVHPPSNRRTSAPTQRICHNSDGAASVRKAASGHLATRASIIKAWGASPYSGPHTPTTADLKIRAHKGEARMIDCGWGRRGNEIPRLREAGGFLAHRNHQGVEMRQKFVHPELPSERIVKNIQSTNKLRDCLIAREKPFEA